ncbi:MAG: dihydroneopterin aldolase [Actinobacteria bacterium]|nr:dihydroneopterin aldolase [Actinomycetota bacterium]
MADQIVIRGIRGIGHHGVLDHERVDGQPFSVDVRLDLDTAVAAGSDSLDDTVDYGRVAKAVHELIVGEPVDLIETLAERIATACLDWPAVHRVRVTVHKPQAPIEVPFDDVEVRITRRRGE